MTGQVTASLPEQNRLPLWRLITGISVLAILVGLLVMAGLVYLDNFRLDRYMNSLAAQPDATALSDAALTDRILVRAKDLNLSVQASDITVTRKDGKPQIRIARYMVQTSIGRLDLRLPEAASH